MKQKQPAPELARRLAPSEVYHMVAGLLRDESLFLIAVQQLRGEYFTQAFDSPVRVVWDVAVEIFRQHGSSALFGDVAKAYKLVELGCMAHCQSNPETSTAEITTFLFGSGGRGFIHWIYLEIDATTFHRDNVGQLLSSFIRERAVNDAWRSLVLASGNEVITNFDSLSTLLSTKASSASTILSGQAVRSASPSGWRPAPSRRRPTGISWLDKFLRGGHAAGETYFLLGAIGSGKTTFGLQLLSSVAELEWLYAVSPEARDLAGLPPTHSYEVGHVYYFHYEMAEEDIRVRLWSGCARIELDRIYQLGTPGFELSTSANLTAEGQALLNRVRAQTGLSETSLSSAAFPGEAERLRQAQNLLSTNVWQIDCHSGKVGQGYLHEVASILRAEVAAGRRIAAVVIDYASACVARHTSDKDATYAMLNSFGQLTEAMISDPFQAPVWVLQQLKGVANQRTAASRPSHSDALGCTTMGAAFWYAFGIGTTDDKTGCRYFVCSKARRSDLGKPPILKIAGGFNRLIDVSDEYYFDSAGQIRTKVGGVVPGHVPGGASAK